MALKKTDSGKDAEKTEKDLERNQKFIDAFIENFNIGKHIPGVAYLTFLKVARESPYSVMISYQPTALSTGYCEEMRVATPVSLMQSFKDFKESFSKVYSHYCDLGKRHNSLFRILKIC